MSRDDAVALIAKVAEMINKLDPDDSAGFMALTDELREEDFTFVGKLIQTYCYADLNARRIIDGISGAAGKVQNGSILNDTDVLLHLRKVAETLPPSNVREGILRAVELVEMHREQRHNFAHWAVRRIKDHDVFVIFTKNAHEAKKRDGVELPQGEFKFGLAPVRLLKEELEKLVGHSKYLAESAIYVEKNISSLREYYNLNGNTV
jgi:hypothetical protein